MSERNWMLCVLILPDVILDRVDDDLFQMLHYPVALDIFVDN